MAQINPHILFKGNTLDAFEFYRSVFGGSLTQIIRFKDLPHNENQEIPENEGNKIINITLPIGKSTQLMGSDVAEVFMDQELITGNRYTIVINADSREEADHLFNGLSDGGVIEFPLNDSFWGSYFGMFADKFGIQWLIEFKLKSEIN